MIKRNFIRILVPLLWLMQLTVVVMHSKVMLVASR